MASPRRRFPSGAVVAVVAAFILTSSCGGGSTPSSSTPPTTVAPAPTPAPGPIFDPWSQPSCSIGKGDVNAECGRRSDALRGDVEAAMDALVQQRPQIFDLNDEYSPDTRAYKVLDKDAYVNGLVANLRAAGLCSERDPDDALLQVVRVKNAAEFSEDYDVLLASGHMRRGPGAYRQTCRPSAFPVDRAADAPPIGSGCGRPYPPPISYFNCKVHIKSPEYYSLDSTPLVSDPAYCASIGFPDRANCPVRVEGAVDRAACENWRVGTARDTGRPGPTWTKADGTYCTGPDSGCENHPDNQYKLYTYVSGSYTVRAANGVSCTVTH